MLTMPPEKKVLSSELTNVTGSLVTRDHDPPMLGSMNQLDGSGDAISKIASDREGASFVLHIRKILDEARRMALIEIPADLRIGKEVALGQGGIQPDERDLEMALQVSRLVRVASSRGCGVFGPGTEITAGYAEVDIDTGSCRC